MKFLLSGVALLALAASPGRAADLMAPQAPVVPTALPAAASGFDWSGFYLGAQVGYGFADGDGSGCPFDDAGCDVFTDPGAEFFVDSSSDDDGVLAGGHLGVDAQLGSFVLGALVEGNWVDFGSRDFTALYDPDIEEAGALLVTDADLPGADAFEIAGIAGTGAGITPGEIDAALAAIDPLYDISGSTEIDWYGTARLRAGFVPGAGRFLLYGTGGLAFGSGQTSASGTVFYTEDESDFVFGSAGDGDPSDGYAAGDAAGLAGCADYAEGGGTAVSCKVTSSDEQWMWGYALGGGADFLATSNFSLGMEYLFVNLNGDFDSSGLLDGLANGGDRSFHTVSVRGSLRFGGGMIGGS